MKARFIHSFLVCSLLFSLANAAFGQTVTVSPTTASLKPGQVLQVGATVSPTAQAVTWRLSSPIGTLSTSGLRAVYAAPSVVTATQTVEIIATSMSNAAVFAKVLVTLMPAVTLTLTPSSVDLGSGESKVFTVHYQGATNQTVAWSVEPAVGTITPLQQGLTSATGRYTAPHSITGDQTVRVYATIGTTQSNVGRINLKKQTAISFTTSDRGLATLVYDGTDRNYRYDEGLATLAWFIDAQGSTVQATPSCARSFNATTVTHDCSANGNRFQIVARYATPRGDTISANIQLTNQSAVKFTKILISAIGLQFPQIDATQSKFGTVGAGNPLGWASYVSGRFAIWQEYTKADTTVNVWCNASRICKNQMQILELAPGESKTRQYNLRFSNDPTMYAPHWVPEAYQSYREANPPVIKWADRRPIMQWYIAEGTKRSALNPRGYFQDALLDVSRVDGFRQRAIASAQRVRELMNARPVRPQGIIIWDLEGQEFNHATTYIGDPRVFASGYAPEMNAVVDEIFKTFRDAGYRVGVTIRPQYLDWGTKVPSACRFDATNDYKQYFIKVDGAFRQKFFACYDTAGRNWSLIPNSNGSQTSFNRDATAVLALLRSKIQYARQRWEATLFYVDSAVWVGGAPLQADIFKALQREFPGILLIPEQETMDHLSTSIPFTDPRNSGDPRFSPVPWRWTYPEGAMGIQLSDCRNTCWLSNAADFKAGIKGGDIPLYAQPQQMYPPQLTAIETLIQEAQRENSTIVVTDKTSGRQHSFTGTPATVHSYPVKMRVYFGMNLTDLASSTLFCEASQWPGANTCTLDLRTSRFSQIRYFDFTNTFVKSEAAVGLR